MVAEKYRLLQLWCLTALWIPLLSVTGRPLLRWVDGWLSRPVLAWLLGTMVVAALAWAVYRLGRYRLLIGLTAALMTVAVLWWVPRGEERLHFLLFGALGYLGVSALGPWRSLAACMLLAVGDELLQALLPDRVGDLRDVAMNAGAAGIGFLLAVGARW